MAEPGVSKSLIPTPISGHDPEQVPSTSNPKTSILSCHLLLGLPSDRFPTKILFAFMVFKIFLSFASFVSKHSAMLST
jgi:hypothetical protein